MIKNIEKTVPKVGVSWNGANIKEYKTEAHGARRQRHIDRDARVMPFSGRNIAPLDPYPAQAKTYPEERGRVGHKVRKGRDDMRILLNHSTSAVTDGYIHDKGERVGRVANVIQKFPEDEKDVGVSQKFPKSENDARKPLGVFRSEL